MTPRTAWLAAATTLLIVTAACSEREPTLCPLVYHSPTIVIEDADHDLPPSVTVGGTVCSGGACTDVRERRSSSPPIFVSYESTELRGDLRTIRYDLTARDDAGALARKMTGTTKVTTAFPNGPKCSGRAISTIRP